MAKKSHVHEWKDAPDWAARPGYKAQECFRCRGLRFVKVKGDQDA